VTAYLVDAWTALGDPSRRRLFECLVDGPRTVAELTAALPISQPAVSQHLKVLRAAELVDFESRGTRRLYHVKPDGLAALRADLDRFWSTALTNFQRLAEAEAADRKGSPT
jgi:DNA-binding transcriptional ArsR family regulator